MQKTQIAAMTDGPAAKTTRPDQSIALSEIDNVLVQKALDIWEAARGAKPMPSRADMSPRIMASLLRNTALVRVIGAGDEFELRIVGDIVVQAQGASLQGMTTAEIDLVLPGYGSVLRYVYTSVYESGAPQAFRGWFVREADGHAMFHESLMLPLGEDGNKPDHLLGVGVYAVRPDQTLR